LWLSFSDRLQDLLEDFRLVTELDRDHYATQVLAREARGDQEVASLSMLKLLGCEAVQSAADGTSPVDVRVGLVENGDTFRLAFEGMAADPRASATTVTVAAIEGVDETKPNVTYTLLMGGAPVMPDQVARPSTRTERGRSPQPPSVPCSPFTAVATCRRLLTTSPPTTLGR
jgi:hypothetical protein